MLAFGLRVRFRLWGVKVSCLASFPSNAQQYGYLVVHSSALLKSQGHLKYKGKRLLRGTQFGFEQPRTHQDVSGKDSAARKYEIGNGDDYADICMLVYIHIYIYIYIARERDTYTHARTQRQRDTTHTHTHTTGAATEHSQPQRKGQHAYNRHGKPEALTPTPIEPISHTPETPTPKNSPKALHLM